MYKAGGEGKRGREGGGELVASLLLNFSLSSCWIVVIESPRFDFSTSPNTACKIAFEGIQKMKLIPSFKLDAVKLRFKFARKVFKWKMQRR